MYNVSLGIHSVDSESAEKQHKHFIDELQRQIDDHMERYPLAVADAESGFVEVVKAVFNNSPITGYNNWKHENEHSKRRNNKRSRRETNPTNCDFIDTDNGYYFELKFWTESKNITEVDRAIKQAIKYLLQRGQQYVFFLVYDEGKRRNPYFDKNAFLSKLRKCLCEELCKSKCTCEEMLYRHFVIIHMLHITNR